MADPSKIQESKDRYLREKVDRFLVTVPKGQNSSLQTSPPNRAKV